VAGRKRNQGDPVERSTFAGIGYTRSMPDHLFEPFRRATGFWPVWGAEYRPGDAISIHADVVRRHDTKLRKQLGSLKRANESLIRIVDGGSVALSTTGYTSAGPNTLGTIKLAFNGKNVLLAELTGVSREILATTTQVDEKLEEQQFLSGQLAIVTEVLWAQTAFICLSSGKGGELGVSASVAALEKPLASIELSVSKGTFVQKVFKPKSDRGLHCLGIKAYRSVPPFLFFRKRKTALRTAKELHLLHQRVQNSSL
jgi:hypothetical protein